MFMCTPFHDRHVILSNDSVGAIAAIVAPHFGPKIDEICSEGLLLPGAFAREIAEAILSYEPLTRLIADEGGDPFAHTASAEEVRLTAGVIMSSTVRAQQDHRLLETILSALADHSRVLGGGASFDE